MTNWINYLMSRKRWRSSRYVTPPLVTYYWDGERATPAPQSIKDISVTGLYLLTERRWYPGTLIVMTLQTSDNTDADAENAITVLAKVIWSGSDGVGFKFVFTAAAQEQSMRTGGNQMADKKAFKRFLQRFEKGKASKG
jgi:PilZ domain